VGLPTINDTTVLERDDEGPALRIFKPFTQITFKREDAGTAKTVKMDKLGFCNPPQNDYDARAIDIVTIGDSFTWCQSASRRMRDPKPNFRYHIKFSAAVVAFNSSNVDTDEVMHAKCLHNREINLEVFTEALQAFVKLSRQRTNFVR
jgi:hypothetical protein